MNFKQLIQLKALENIRAVSGTGSIIDAALAQPDSSLAKSGQMRNVCAMVTNELFDDLEGFTKFMDISKREFIEAAIIKALEEAKQIAGEVGLWEALEAHQNAQKGGE